LLVMPTWVANDLPQQFFAEAEPLGDVLRTQASNGEALERFLVFRVSAPQPGTAAASLGSE
jgi:hypothetical protein